MKNISFRPKLLLLAVMIITGLSSFTQKQFLHTATRANNSCNGDCTILDNAELNNNPNAIIFVKPHPDNGVNPNPQTLGVYYFKGKWNIINLDQATIPAGSKFNVEYVNQEDAKFFQYTIKAENIRKDGSAMIDHASLNNNPGAIFSLFPSWNPDVQGGMTNRDQVTTQYDKDEGKWVISNINQKPLFARVVYNLALQASGGTTSTNVPKAVQVNQLTVLPANTWMSPIGFMYMTAWADGVQLPGETHQVMFAGKTEMIGYEFKGKIPAGTRSLLKNVYDPIIIKIPSGLAATTPLLNAFIKGQAMEFILETYSNLQTGKMGLNYTIKISGAKITSFRQLFDANKESGTGKSVTVTTTFDEISIVFTSIEITKGNTVITDPF